MANSDQVTLAHHEEVTYDTVPATALQNDRFTSESLAQRTNSTQSAEITAGRQISDIIRTGVNAAGDINHEFSYGAMDDFWEALLFSADWTTPHTEINGATDISFESVATSPSAYARILDASNGFTGGTNDYVAPQWVRVTGATNASNNGVFKLQSVAAGILEIVNGAGIVDEAAGQAIIIQQGGQIVNGTTFRSFGIEKVYTDLTNAFRYFGGMAADRGNQSIVSDQIVTGGITFLGSDEAINTATNGTGPNVAAPTNDVMNAIDHVQAIFDGALETCARGMTWEVVNNLREKLKVGQLGAFDIGSGTFAPTGTLSVYLDNSSRTELAYINFTETSLAVTYIDAQGNAYAIDFPAVKLTQNDRNAGGQNQDIIEEINWSAKRHATEGITMRMVRFPALP